jgi:hypothetical protein
MLGLLAVVLFILLVVSIYHEARSLLNPILLIVFLMVSYLAIIEFLYSHGYYTAYGVFLLLLISTPLIIFLGGLFLVYNGIILLHK